MGKFEKIAVKPIAGALGAEIEGVDLARPMDNSTAEEVHRAFLDHSVIFFRDQDLTPDQHKAFGRQFGELVAHPYLKALDGHPEIIEIVKEAEEVGKFNFGGVWHSDMTYVAEPPLGSVLYAKEVPPYGGDTLWTSMYLAYETLSDGMKALLEGLVAQHTGGTRYGAAGHFAKDGDYKSMQINNTSDADHLVEHPLVRTHPETRRKALYVNPNFTVGIKGLTEAEAKPILQFLFDHSVRPEFTCRFRWTKNAIAFWDNRCTQHFALNDYDGFRRHMHRITVAGDRPF